MTTFYCSKNHLPKQCSHIIIYDKQRPTLTLLLHTPAHVYTTLTKGKPEWDYRKNKTKQKITFWKTGNLTRKLKCKNINESSPHTHTYIHTAHWLPGFTVPSPPAFLTAVSPLFHPFSPAAPMFQGSAFTFLESTSTVLSPSGMQAPSLDSKEGISPSYPQRKAWCLDFPWMSDLCFF